MTIESVTKTPTRMSCGTLRELFGYNDWANLALLNAAAGLPDAALDRPFEMGMGSLRATLVHLAGSERVWLARWQGSAAPPEPRGAACGELEPLFAATSAARNRLLDAVEQAALEAPLTYTNSRGETLTLPVGFTMLHVGVHSQHHRAQALNMLRHCGAALPKPNADYIFWKLAQPGGGTAAATPPPLDFASLQTFYAFGDWAQMALLDLAERLDAAQLDRPFEMGCGTLRATLAHIRFAEQWWLENWMFGPGRPFPETDPGIRIADLRQLTQETFAARNAFLAPHGADDAFLARVVRGIPRPNVLREFPLGVTMLQLCLHGVHHRAQAVNMLRHVGVSAPPLGVASKFRFAG